MEPKCNLGPPKITKKQETQALKKTSKTQHCKKGVRACLGGGSANALFRAFFKRHPQNPQNGPQGQPGPSKMTKNHDFHSQHLANPLPTIIILTCRTREKTGMLSRKAPKEMPRWRLCAQRIGYL